MLNDNEPITTVYIVVQVKGTTLSTLSVWSTNELAQTAITRLVRNHRLFKLTDFYVIERILNSSYPY